MKSILFWSGGKDAAYSLYLLYKTVRMPDILLTTVDTSTGTVPIHEVNEALIKQQSESLRIPLKTVYYDSLPTANTYETEVLKALGQLKAQGFDTVICGDLFLDDIRQYRLQLHAQAGFRTEFPLWGMNTNELANAFIDAGFKAIVVSVDTKFLTEEYCGKLFNKTFLTSLPPNVDPCGENGEFHTFVFDGPTFKNPANFFVGKKKEQTLHSGSPYETTMWYVELLPGDN